MLSAASLRRRKSNKGFSMVEVMIVLVLIALLAAAAFVGGRAIVNRTKANNVKQAAMSFDRQMRNLAEMDAYDPTLANTAGTAWATGGTRGAPVRGSDVAVTADDMPTNVTVWATAGTGALGVNAKTASPGATAADIANVVTTVQFRIDDVNGCLTLGTTAGAVGTYAATACTGFVLP